MTESLHPHGHKGKIDNVTPITQEVDESIDPSELERHKLLEQFLSQCRHPSLHGSEATSAFIVSTLQSGPDQPWGHKLKQLKVDVTEFDDTYFEQMRIQDEIFALIYKLIIQTEASFGGNEGKSIVRKALLELFDLRAGVTAQFDRSQLTNERNEGGWSVVLDKVVPRNS